MKKILSLFLAVLLCGSVNAAESKASLDTVVRPAHAGNYYAIKGDTTGPLKIRDLLQIYATGKDSKRTAAVVKLWSESEWVRTATLDAVTQLTETATKAKDPRATIYRRASEKLAQQIKESSLRQDAQAAVADALKALEEKS